jgi:hypothetical protein
LPQGPAPAFAARVGAWAEEQGQRVRTGTLGEEECGWIDAGPARRRALVGLPALLCYTAPADEGDERELAVRLAAELGQPVALLRLDVPRRVGREVHQPDGSVSRGALRASDLAGLALGPGAPAGGPRTLCFCRGASAAALRASPVLAAVAGLVLRPAADGLLLWGPTLANDQLAATLPRIVPGVESWGLSDLGPGWRADRPGLLETEPLPDDALAARLGLPLDALPPPLPAALQEEP